MIRFNIFWSHVVYDKDFLNPLLYFLQESLPFYVSLKNIFEDNETALRLYEKVCRNGIVIVCRLITNRESEIEFMSKEKQAEILYSNFIISIPMIFDLVTLLGSNNKTLLQKIIETLVKIEPKYLNDLKMGIKFIQSTFIKMREQLKVIETENRDLDEKYEDITLYLMNIASTLNLIIDTASNELKTFCSRDFHLEQSIASLYDNFIPILYNLAYSFDPDAWFLTYISYARIELINCYRNLINRGISAILNAGDKNRRKLADEILSILTECAGYKTFIIDYVQMYPIEMDLDIITQGGKNIDKIKLNFVSDAYKIDQAASKLSNGHHNNDIVDPLNGDEEFEGACALPVHQNEFSKASMTTQNVEEVLQIETSKILELFPHYGVGYIRRLLAYYNNNSEEVISKIVEGNLDSSFNDCDIDEPYIPKDIPDKVFLATGLERSNIYDGDKRNRKLITNF
ncbi:CLUMA_CG015438, isoform A [Clunio marinus]|uniref:CLUMA_CG015438, isoform A n=1 Tax=Clunio marinus TaxID=568069 RepID=A0A1J1IUK6_9DIPT|nr:CLUMA_CG015438, isoform A [Clunio marinus]